MRPTSADTVAADSSAAAYAAEVPDPVVAFVLVVVWIGSGLLTARVMAARGHEFRFVAGIAAALGPLFVPLALDHLHRRDPRTTPVALEGELGEGRRTVIVLGGAPERAADVLPILRRLDDLGHVTVVVPVGYSTLRAPEHDEDRRAAEERARSAALLLQEYGAVPVLAPGTTSDVVEHLVNDDDLVLAVGAFPARAHASADRLGANVVTVPVDGVVDVQLVAALAAHALIALVVGLAGRRMGRRVLLLAAVAPAIAFGVAVAATPAVLDGDVIEVAASWVPGMGLTLDLALDGFGLLMWWIIAGIGVLVFLYASRYFDERDDLGRFAALLVTFAGAMLLLTSADDVYALFVAWEITSITSYLLIGFKDEETAARASALQALLVTGAGGLALLGGLVLVSQAAGTSSLAAILADPPAGGAVEAGLVLVLLGAMTKSAQVPFHFWLPGAMAAPTPVSAYLHSATMVKAGIYLLARFAPAFGPEVAWWPPVLLAVGGATMLLGGWRALRADDLKELLAFGTVSQLGFIVLLVGTGDPELLFAGVGVLVAHSLFKATLFLSVGVVDHGAHTRDIRRLDGIGRAMPITAVAGTVAAASMAGVIPLLGFVAKESALEGAIHYDANTVLVGALIVVGSALTTAYGIRFVRGAFLSKPADELHDGAVTAADVHAPDRLFEFPAALLAVLTVLFGLWVAPVDALVVGGAGALEAEAAGFHLKLWHGFGLSLLLSTTAVVGGVIVWRLPGVVRRAARVTSRVPEARSAYRGGLRGLFELADRTVSIVQPGSLPIYLGVILLTLVVLPGAVLVGGVPLEIEEVASSPLQAAVALGIVAAAIGTAYVRKRLSTVLLLGGVGFGVAVLFVMYGAPDLALTQLLIDTLSIGIFVLVLRKLPEDFTQPAFRLGNGVRIVISFAVGALVTVMALAVTTVRTGTGAADQFLARALPEGGGKNVVNVILTDFRALDTLGEVTVLAVAAVGVLSMVRAARDDEDGPDVDPAEDVPGDGEIAGEPAEVAS